MADPVARSFGLDDSPNLRVRPLRASELGITRISIGRQQLGLTPQIPPEDTFVAAMYLTPVRQHELWSRGRPVLSQGYGANAMRIVNLQAEYAARIFSPHEALTFTIPRAVVDEFTDDAGGARIANLSCAPGIVDPVMTHLAAALLPAFDKPGNGSRLFVDHVALAICAHLTHAYGGFRPNGVLPKGGLTPLQAARAQDLLASGHHDDLSIAEVARACGLSRGYFIRAFKATLGVTPHQWQQRHRIDKAKGMLRGPASVAEIALACGFTDQSHLTRVFARTVGDTPAAWRRRLR